MENESEVLKNPLQGHQLKLTRQRKVSLDTLLTMPRPVSAEELYEASIKKNASIGLATIYRALHLCKAGLIMVFSFSKRPRRTYSGYPHGIQVS